MFFKNKGLPERQQRASDHVDHQCKFLVYLWSQFPATLFLCINFWQKQSLSWLEASWINNIQLSSSSSWPPTKWLLTGSELIWLMLPNIFSMMIQKNCSSVDRFARIETCWGSDSAKLILEPFFSAAIFSQVMALSRMIVYSTKRFMSPLRIEPSIWRATRGEASSMIAWREERIYVREKSYL